MNGDAVRYAGFWRRSGAFLIDSAVLFMLFAPILFVLHGVDYFRWALEHNGLLAYYSLPELSITRAAPLILVVAMWVRCGWTPGKLLMECRVADARSGGRVSIGQALVRYLGYLLSMLPFYLGFMWMAWDRRKQGFHDKLAGTVVVRASDDDSRRSLEQLMEETS